MTFPSRPHLLHLLFEEQQRFRCISDAAMREIAAKCDLPVAQVKSVVEFYSFFSRLPRGRFDLRLSGCPACGRGHASFLRQLGQRLGVGVGATRHDGLVSIDTTSCIGMCDQGAAALINGRTLTRIDAARCARIANLIEAETPLADWPADWFAVANPVHRRGLLLKETFAPGEAVAAAARLGRDGVLAEVERSGLRGRGGAGFPTGKKWRFCRDAQGLAHYVVCNADEGEPGTFKDRLLLSEQAEMLFEGMTLCGYAIGANKGYLYLRGEYRFLLAQLETTLGRRRQRGLLGDSIAHLPGFAFDIEIVVGAGAYICGEESALLESLEEKRGVPRLRPPFPVTHGLYGQPTVVNNVETLAAAARIVQFGGSWFASQGSEQSTGSKLFSIGGDCRQPGIYELPFGLTLRQLLLECGGEEAIAVQVGGPSGALVGPADYDRHLGFEDLATGGAITVYGPDRDLLSIVRANLHFFAHESCGFCTPCRVGTSLLQNGIDKICEGHGTRYDLDELLRLAALTRRRSHCGLGQTAANPLLDFSTRFPALLESRLVGKSYEPWFDLDAALGEARTLTHRDDPEAHLL